MPKQVLPLTDLKIQKAKPKKKQYTMFDGKGLYLLVSTAGGKLWRYKYRYEGRQRLMALGSYPEVSLDEARRRHDEARQLLASNIDPGAAKKEQTRRKIEEKETFEVIAREWFDKFRHTWSERHAETVISRLTSYVFPYLGDQPISDIGAPEVLSVLRRLEARGVLETAHRTKIICGQVFRYAVATGRAQRDPTTDLRGAIPPAEVTHMPAITDPVEVGALLRAIDAYEGSHIVESALKLAPLLFVRPGELRTAEWKEIDLEKAEWNIPARKMKIKEPHLVPLSRQAVAILRNLHKITGEEKYVFPGRNARPMSDNAVLTALRAMGYEKERMTGHGFRAMARTLLDEVLHYRLDLIEHQLAHTVRDPLGRAYNRTKYLKERREMMQNWADYLDGLKVGAKVIPFKAKELSNDD